MSYGFVIRDVNGNVVVSDTTIGFLFLDQFIVAGGATVTKTYSGMAPYALKVVSFGISSKYTDATITVTDSGNDKVVSITTSNQGWFFITKE